MLTVIGVTGTFGSGCSFVAHTFLEPAGYTYISLSDCMREEYKKENGTDMPKERTIAQDYGDKLRKMKGPEYLAKIAFSKMGKDEKYIVDSIRNPAEIKYFEENVGEYYTLGIIAPHAVRWSRVADVYGGNQTLFDADEARDKEGKEDYGQQVEKCFERVDYVIYNEQTAAQGNAHYNHIADETKRFLQLVTHDKNLHPNLMETTMTVAQAVAHRSSCLRRKVGAAIIDSVGGVVATGYNEVPPSNMSCQDKYGGCYRVKLRHEFRRKVQSILQDEKKTDEVCGYYKANVKLMDYCRALHAEENALLSLVRNGNIESIGKAVLYTTTFPCNLCANKIASVGIKRIVYSSPYPMKEAKEILEKSEVKTEPFVGITYRGYFKMEGNMQ